MRPSVLVIAPEAPWPLQGGGAYRTASLIQYFAAHADVDLILFSETGQPALVPAGLLRSQTVIQLAQHSRSTSARYLRNIRRAIQGVPPLVDRLSGHEDEIARVLKGKHYDLGLVEHFWCAPYIAQISAACGTTVLDLHNIESVLHERCAETSGGLSGNGLVGAGHKRFAQRSRELEATFLPRYTAVLTPSQVDAYTVRRIAPGANVIVYPNAIPDAPYLSADEESTPPVVVFSANFEYHPNIDAVGCLVSTIWPEVMKVCPELRLRLVGRGDQYIRPLLPSGFPVEITGPIEDARAEIREARIVIAPLRAGSGTRIKILEAWAEGRPVVATSLAAEGLEYSEDTDLLIANDGPAFATAIAKLNQDSLLRARVGTAGRLLFEKHYTWQAAWKLLKINPEFNFLFPGAAAGGRYTDDADANRR